LFKYIKKGLGLKSRNKIICAKWGSLYSDDYVNKLYRDIKKNCSVDFDFECFTEFDETWDQYKNKHYRASIDPDHRFDTIQNGYHRDDFGGIPHYRKITLFNEDKKFKETDTVLYLDLDTNIEGDLAYFFEELNDDKPYIVWNYWWDDPYYEDGYEWKRQYHITRCPLFNSSVLRWKPGQNRHIYNFVNNNPDKCFFTYPSMDTFMFHQFGPYSYEPRTNHFQYYKEGIVTTQRELKENQKPGIINMLEGMSLEEKSSNVST
jgi:hypothetical protein|tara:strand:- start:419 stop:1204 length:786 start_codon:yes stop_codon:yes gene_type:complete